MMEIWVYRQEQAQLFKVGHTDLTNTDYFVYNLRFNPSNHFKPHGSGATAMNSLC